MTTDPKPAVKLRRPAVFNLAKSLQIQNPKWSFAECIIEAKVRLANARRKSDAV